MSGCCPVVAQGLGDLWTGSSGGCVGAATFSLSSGPAGPLLFLG